MIKIPILFRSPQHSALPHNALLIAHKAPTQGQFRLRMYSLRIQVENDVWEGINTGG